jgi:hypothetical protein
MAGASPSCTSRSPRRQSRQSKRRGSGGPTGRSPRPSFPSWPRPEDFEAVALTTQREAIHDTVVCTTDAEPIVNAIDRFVGAGFDTIYLHQVGPDQQRLTDLARTDLLPHYRATS